MAPELNKHGSDFSVLLSVHIEAVGETMLTDVSQGLWSTDNHHAGPSFLESSDKARILGSVLDMPVLDMAVMRVVPG